MGIYIEANLGISSELAALLSGTDTPEVPLDADTVVDTAVDVAPDEVAADVEAIVTVSTPAIAEVQTVTVPSPLEHAAAWWQETLASAPPLHHKGLKEHIEDSWYNLVARLKGY